VGGAIAANLDSKAGDASSIAQAVDDPHTPEALTALARKIERSLADETQGAVSVRELKPLAGGACQDNYRVDLALKGGELAGERRMVLAPGTMPKRR
jgi:hypothetical protein